MRLDLTVLDPGPLLGLMAPCTWQRTALATVVKA